ncbi:hypothetical protein TI39_contig469g00005 [Zymoseptoria brevis]|uniref:Uncharacterized protein n=1 Tax=Zymoseptoria brevis TaxID=1047168 RepID=A0A0F4GKC5_9PEZI|nr:hypothetical protein TI39_contig469g00005 [Zymoseptoria brevis]
MDPAGKSGVKKKDQLSRMADHATSAPLLPATSTEAEIETCRGNDPIATTMPDANGPHPQNAQVIDPSPKRKRDALSSPTKFQHSNLRAESPPTMPGGPGLSRALSPGSGPDSPRSKVAARFEGLQIRGGPVAEPRFGDEVVAMDVDGERRKRMRLSPVPDVVMNSPTRLKVESGVRARTPPPAAHRRDAATPGMETEMHDLEIGETPNAYTSTTSPSPQSSSTTSSPTTSFKTDLTTHPSRPSSPPPSSDPITSLTWHPSEITGHNYDPLTGPASGDDGTGLNGVGFRPTPAVAYARAQKRRAQVSEWKAREAREARGRRAERRKGSGDGGRGERGGVSGVGGDGDGERGRRMVRFWGVE